MKPQGLPLFARVAAPDALEKGSRSVASNVPGKGVESPFGAKLASAMEGPLVAKGNRANAAEVSVPTQAGKVTDPTPTFDNPLTLHSFQEAAVSTLQPRGEIAQTPVNDVPTLRQESVREPAHSPFVMPPVRRTPVPLVASEQSREVAVELSFSPMKHATVVAESPAAFDVARVVDHHEVQTLQVPSAVPAKEATVVGEPASVLGSPDAPTPVKLISPVFSPLMDVPAFLLNPPTLHVVPLRHEAPTLRQEDKREPAHPLLVVPPVRRAPAPLVEPALVREVAVELSFSPMKQAFVVAESPAAVAVAPVAAPVVNQHEVQTLLVPSALRPFSKEYVRAHDATVVEVPASVLESPDAPTPVRLISPVFSPLMDVPAFLLSVPALHVVPFELKAVSGLVESKESPAISFVGNEAPKATVATNQVFVPLVPQARPAEESAVAKLPAPAFPKAAETASPKAVAALAQFAPPTTRNEASKATVATPQAFVSHAPQARPAANTAVVAQPTPAFAKAVETASPKAVAAPAQLAPPTTRNEAPKATVATNQVFVPPVPQARPAEKEVILDRPTPAFAKAAETSSPKAVAAPAQFARPTMSNETPKATVAANQVVVPPAPQARPAEKGVIVAQPTPAFAKAAEIGSPKAVAFSEQVAQPTMRNEAPKSAVAAPQAFVSHAPQAQSAANTSVVAQLTPEFGKAAETASPKAVAAPAQFAPPATRDEAPRVTVAAPQTFVSQVPQAPLAASAAVVAQPSPVFARAAETASPKAVAAPAQFARPTMSNETPKATVAANQVVVPPAPQARPAEKGVIVAQPTPAFAKAAEIESPKAVAFSEQVAQPTARNEAPKSAVAAPQAFVSEVPQTQLAASAAVVAQPTPAFAKTAEIESPNAVAFPEQVAQPTARNEAPKSTVAAPQAFVPSVPQSQSPASAAIVAQPTPAVATAAETSSLKAVAAPVQFAQPMMRNEASKFPVASATEVPSILPGTARSTPTTAETVKSVVLNKPTPVERTQAKAQLSAVPSSVPSVADAVSPTQSGIQGVVTARLQSKPGTSSPEQVKNEVFAAVEVLSRPSPIVAGPATGSNPSSVAPALSASPPPSFQGEQKPRQGSDGKQERPDFEFIRPAAVEASTANVSPPVQSVPPTTLAAATSLPPVIPPHLPAAPHTHTRASEGSFVPARANPLTGSDLLELSQFGNAKIDLNNNEARISLETDSGALSLHVRVRQGVTDVSLDGQAAAQFGAHSRDLEAYLSKEGLTLGRFVISDQRLPTGELGDGDARGQNSSRQEPDENVGTENAETSSERPVSGKPPRVRTSGRVHVKA